MNAQQIIEKLQLSPHEREGGRYRRTFTSSSRLDTAVGARAAATCIYYLLEADTFSELHRLRSDEIFHFYLGDPVEMLQLYPDGSSARLILGQDLAAGQQVQTLVPQGVWQGSRLLPGGSFALMGCSVTPGFDFADYEGGNFADLSHQWPWEAERIRALTRR